MATKKVIFDTNCFGVARVNRTVLPYMSGQCSGPVVELTSSRKAKFANKFGSFAWRKGIELGFFTSGTPITMESKSLPINEKALLNAYLTHI